MNKKMLLISNLYPNEDHPEYGTFVKEFVTGLGELNWHISKIVLNKKNGKIHKIVSYISFLFRSWLSLNTNKDDITYIHYASHSTIPLVVSRKQKFLVINVHGSDILPNHSSQKYFSFFTKYALLHADLIVVPSEYFKKVVLEKYNVADDIIFISPSGGVDTYFYQDRVHTPIKNQMVMGYVGRIESVKGWRTFLSAINNSEIDNTHYLIFGSGSEEENLICEIKKMGNPNIEYMGPIRHNDLPNIYQSLDWLIFPSESESLGLVGIESMATGTPLIASNIGGIRTYAEHKKNSLLFESGNSTQLADCILSVKNMKLVEWQHYSNQAFITAKKYEKKAVMKQLNAKLLSFIK
ncbi:glycosyltransferase family 1 protein [Leuconostoc falkenbergense]|uniref:glycosyltransferase n=1 Tax=Leuconostoc falkenbergense TaxID=2766470 RepID=UPI0021AABD5D|nr:glycosyltransferase [Leuconostoc falkenbergense]MCT4411953.1 glycosyltransferase family 1 protein [Leuconostoc falkenbergense]